MCVSVENGAISTFAERWPVMIDPQLQGIVWVKEKVPPLPPSLPLCLRACGCVGAGIRALWQARDIEKEIYIWMDGWMNGWMDGWVDT